MKLNELTKRFSDPAKRIIGIALKFAGESGHSYFGSEHLLYGIAAESGSNAYRLLRERGVTASELRRRILGIVGTGTPCTVTAENATPTCRRILMRASGKTPPILPEHLLLSLLREDCVGRRIAEHCGADVAELTDILEELYGKGNDACVRAEKPRKSTPLLDKNATDLTEKALSGKIDPVIGREKEEEEVLSILLRRTKNNPCLIGEAGVGKTAIVESVAARIARGDVPEALLGARVLSLELANVVAGTKYRGEFEEKIKGILAEAKDTPEIILFIDEIHTIVGAGAAEGAIDASNILKPALARGEIKLIGATTYKEYKKCIEKDAALDRRFRLVRVEEPEESECLRILQGVCAQYERFHGVRYLPEALERAAVISSRYLPFGQNPDKALDLLDETGARQRMRGGDVVCAEDVTRIAREKTHIPFFSLSEEENERFATAERRLRETVLGQDEAVGIVCSALKRARAGIREEEKPFCSFLFYGPSGVGKTATAKALSACVGGEDAFLRLDMSEYSEPHSVSRLIGSPPGYSGYGEGGLLTEWIRKHPYAVVLFDELPKAHPEVRALLLQILEEGRLSDASGLTVSFRNALIVLTAGQSGNASGIGFANAHALSVRRDTEALLSGALVERVDEVVRFAPLGKDTLCALALRSLEDLCERMRRKRIRVLLEDGIAERAVASANGSAREVRRTVTKAAEELIADGIFSGEIRPGSEVMLCCENGDMRLRVTQKSAG